MCNIAIIEDGSKQNNDFGQISWIFNFPPLTWISKNKYAFTDNETVQNQKMLFIPMDLYEYDPDSLGPVLELHLDDILFDRRIWVVLLKALNFIMWSCGRWLH